MSDAARLSAKTPAPDTAARSFLWPGVVLGAAMALGLLDQQVIAPLIAALAGGLEVSVPEVGLAISAYAIAAATTALVVGPASDARGRRGFLLAALFVMFCAAALVWLSPHYAHFVLARLAAGMAGGAIAALSLAWVADLVPYERRGKAMAILTGGAMGTAVLGQVAAAFVAERWGHTTVYAGLTVFAAGCFLVLLFGLSEERRSEAKERRLPARRWIRGYVAFFRSNPHRTAALAAFAMSAGLVGITAYAAGWLQETRAFTLGEIGLLYGGFGAAIMLVQPLVGPLADRYGKRRFALVASLIVVALTLVIPSASGALLIVLLLVFGCVAVARMGAFAALRSELVPPERRAAFLAFSNTLSQLGIASAAALGSVLYPLGFFAVCWAMAGFGALAVLFVSLVPEPPLPEALQLPGEATV